MPQAAPVYYGAGGCTYYAQVAPTYHATGDAYLLMLMYGTGRILLPCKRAQHGWLQARAVSMTVRGPGAIFGTPECGWSMKGRHGPTSFKAHNARCSRGAAPELLG